MAASKHFSIRAYLRHHGKDDMCKYHLNWTKGEGTQMGHWGYDNVPVPNAASLISVSPKWVEYETETLHTCDVYEAKATSTESTWETLPLSAVRYPYVSTMEGDGTVTFGCGVWRLSLSGTSHNDNKHTLRTVTVTPRHIMPELENTLRSSITLAQFDFKWVIHTTVDSPIRIKAQKKNSATNYSLEVILLVEKL